VFWRKKAKKKDDAAAIDLAVLKTVQNDFELGILKSMLDDNNIPYIIRDYGAGGHMRIVTGSQGPFRADILVDKSAYETAKEIIEQFYLE